MRTKRFFTLLFVLFAAMLGLTSCSGNENSNTVMGNAVTQDEKIDDVDYLLWKAQVANLTIYNIKDVTFSVGLYKDGELVMSLHEQSEKVQVDHNNRYIVDGKIKKNNIDFDEIKVTNINYTSTSFMDTYITYVIVMPIAVAIFAGIVIFVLSRGSINPNLDTTRPSVVGLVAILILLTMTNSLGWVAVSFLVGAAILVFLSGYITILIRKRNAKVLQEALDSRKKDQLQEVQDEAEEIILDAEVVDLEDKNQDN